MKNIILFIETKFMILYNNIKKIINCILINITYIGKYNKN